MNTLTRALDLVKQSDEDEPSLALLVVQQAHAYAAIALATATERQAAALERIADALEHPNRLRAPDPQDYYSEDEYRQAAELHDYWTNSHPGENMAEYKQRIVLPS